MDNYTFYSQLFKMTPVNQTITEKGRGDCHRAAIASLLDLKIEQVPHFLLFPANIRHQVEYNFLRGCGYSWEGTGYPNRHKDPSKYPNVSGYVMATVPSKHYPPEDNITHAVIMDLNGLVAHDPHPNKDYQSVNIIKSEELLYWMLLNINN